MIEAKHTERVETLRRFNPYPAYKDSGVEWLGEIPAHWDVLALKRRARRIQTGTTPPTSETKYYEDGVIAWYGPGSFADDLPLQAPIKFIAESAVRDGVARVFESGSAMIVTIGATIGKVAYMERAGSCNQQITGVTFDRRHVHAKYGAYQLKRLELVLRGIAPNTTLPILDQEEVGYLPYLVPPEVEQRAIAAFLDRETARIDALVAKKARLIELLQEQRTALITRAVTKGLPSTASTSLGQAGSGQATPNVPMKDSGVEWLGEIPAHWEVRRIRNVVSRIEQGWSPDCENREADDDEWGVLKAGCVNRGLFVESEHKALPSAISPLPELEIHEGDLLMSRASGSRDLVGSVAVVGHCRPKLLLCDKVFRLHVDAQTGHKQFLAYAMNSRIARWQIEIVLSGGSGLANNIAQQVVKDLVVAQPPQDEQRAIAAFLDHETARIDALVAKVGEAIDRLKELRTALISAAVMGKIDVREEVA